ncbi:uncharacterized protein [Miscanthus floridulus]|uniref:uncharacterized protein isoform X4 n=1 Tax=Miscanthus floridulus TaxID=154761 RepID=UPI00345912A9
MEAGGGGAEEEQVMSEVHLGCSPHFSGLHISRFSFSSRPIVFSGPSGDNDGVGGGGSELAAATSGSCDSPDAVAVDEDGDLVLDRRRRNKYVRSDCHLLTIQRGVTSSLKSVGLQVGKKIDGAFLSYRGTDILDNCLANVHTNSGMLKFDEAKVCVRELDWKTSWPPPVGTYDPSDPSRYYGLQVKLRRLRKQQSCLLQMLFTVMISQICSSMR